MHLNVVCEKAAIKSRPQHRPHKPSSVQCPPSHSSFMIVHYLFSTAMDVNSTRIKQFGDMKI